MVNTYPYTDFHELNLDWFLNQFKGLVTDWEKFKTDLTAEWDNLKHDFDALYKYVHDYFDNLDVQTEIDNKLDELIANGTMENILKGIYGETLGVEIVNSTGDMTDPTKTYILSSDPDGYLWFWDGSTFVQSSISYFNPVNALAFVSGTISDLDNLYRQVYAVPTVDLPNVSNIPPTNEGIIVMDLGTNSASSVQIAFNYGNYNPEAPFYIRKKSSSVWTAWVKYNAADYLDFIQRYTTGDDIDNLNRQITKVITTDLPNVQNVPDTTQGMIFVDLGVDANGHAQLAINYSETAVPVIWIRKTSTSGTWGDWYEITRNFYKQITSGDDLDNHNEPGVIYWTNADAKSISNNPISYAGCVSIEYGWPRTTVKQTLTTWMKNWAGGIRFVRQRESDSAPWSEWNIVSADYIHNGYGFTVIGDSLSSGCTTRGTNQNYSFHMESWEKILANKLGCKVYSCSQSGASTAEWLDPSYTWGYKKLARLPKTPVYFINLGINDYNDNVTQADFEANYTSIINMIRTKATDAIIFCCKLWRGNPWDQYNAFIDNVLAAFSSDPRVVEFDISAAVLSAPISNHLYNGHFDIIGYKLIADEVEKEVINIANAHPELFRYEFSALAEGTNYQSNGYPFII